jgi:hypothetical protein
MYGMMDLQEAKRRHEEMLREAELIRAAGLLRKVFRTPKNAD